MSTLTYEPWKDIPAAFVVCLLDKTIPLKQIRKIVKESGIKVVLEIETGHSPFLVKPVEISEFIRKAAGETT